MKRFAVPSVVIVVAVAVVALLVFGVTRTGENRSIDTALAAGSHPLAPARPLPMLDGAGRRSLADYRGKVVVLNFWASWCDPCRAEARALEATQRRIAGHGATVLGVDSQDAPPDAQRFVRAQGITYPSVRDVGGKLASAYGTKQLPETFIVDRRGRVAAVRRFEIDQRWLDRSLAPLLHGRR